MYFLFFKLHSKDSAAAEDDLFRGSLAACYFSGQILK